MTTQQARRAGLPDPLGADWRRPLPGIAGYRRDALLAAALAAGTTLSLLLFATAGVYEDPAQWWLCALYVLGSTGPLAVRRRWPEATAVIVTVVFAGAQILQVPEIFFANINLFIAFYSIGAWGRNRTRAHVVRVLIIAGIFAWIFVEIVARASDPAALPGLDRDGIVSPFVAVQLISLMTNLLYFGAGYYFGDRAWASARERAALEARTVELVAERERSAEQAVALDRLRIARDLHDVVAHHVSVMGVQAGAARRVLATDAREAKEALEIVESNARQAVDELHRMLSTLRDEGSPDAAADSPSTRGVQQLPELVRQAENAGLQAGLKVVGEPRDLPGTVDVTVYRIAQEAVTNTIKHAGASAKLDIRLRYRDESVELEVTDTGGARVAASNGAGLGHIGMRERANAVGGSIEIGPRQRGGYLVRVAIPAGVVR